MHAGVGPGPGEGIGRSGYFSESLAIGEELDAPDGAIAIERVDLEVDGSASLERSVIQRPGPLNFRRCVGPVGLSGADAGGEPVGRVVAVSLADPALE